MTCSENPKKDLFCDPLICNLKFVRRDMQLINFSCLQTRKVDDISVR